jgi:chromosome segregation ATPase
MPQLESQNAGAPNLTSLEEKVHRTVELLGRVREAKAKADEEIENLKFEVLARDEQIEGLRSELAQLRQDREEARQRVERVIAQMDELISAEVTA